MEEYTINLLVRILEMDKKNKYVLFFNSWKGSQFDFSPFKKYSNVTLRRFRIPNKALNFLFWYFGWPHIDKMAGGADLVFMPNIIFGAVSRKTKLILTIHDLSYERYPEYFSIKRRLWHMFINPKKMCRKADGIIAVSESTREDIISLYKIKPEKIQTIHSAADKKFRVIDRNNSKLLEIKEKYDLPFKFILYLGTIEPRKNIISLIRAFNCLQKDEQTELSSYKLVIAGTRGWLCESIFKEINNSPAKDKIIITDFIADKDKEYVYNLASLFVYPSFFEGFGFPPLEAMQCGVPVIASNNSSLPEIVGSSGIMTDPDKPEELYQAMKEILLSRELKERLIKKGLEKTKRFNWEKAARMTLELINKKVL